MPDRRQLVRVLCLAPAALAALGAMGGAAAAEDDWAQCGAGWVLPARPEVERDPGNPEAVFISSDEADTIEGGLTTLIGNVDIGRGSEQLRADRVTYDEATEIVEAEGNVQYWNGGLYVTGDRGRMELLTDQNTLENAGFTDLDSHGRGTADKATTSGDDRFHAENATYTTCNPGSPDWLLTAKQIDLDKTAKVGTARNVWVKFKRVPIFYTPYLSFPLSDERKSGFLAPSGRVSDSTGLEATVPYYFNLAPNRDATVAARPMSDRGIQLQGEYRYLMPWGEGELEAEVVPHDRKFGDDRTAVHFTHTGSFAPRWNSDVNFGWVSDSEYFEDLGTDLSVSSRTFVEQRGDLTYTGDGWWALGRLQHYQTVDDALAATDRPYERLPQFYVATSSRERNRALNLGGFAEVVNFDRSSSVNGTRLDLRPFVSYPMRTPGTFVVPRAAFRFTQYDLDDVAAGADDSPSRAVPTFSLDSGLVMERPLTIGSHSLIQTFEPRAYYLYVPFDSQDDLPVFDTGEYTFSFSQLFRDDRFSGADRVSNANQLALAVTSRFLSPGGDEVFRASVGQIRYFHDRKVTLPGAPRQTRTSSDLVAEVAANVARRWRVLGAIQWNSNAEQTNRSTASVRYQPDERRVLNAAYRFIRDVSESTDVSFTWPVARNWRAVGRWNYALDEATTLEGFAGVEYESCCWGFRTVVRRYLSNSRGEHTNGIFFQLQLKGLAGVGRGTSEFLQKNIPGYKNEF
jgi:LPS-assembly protein